MSECKIPTFHIKTPLLESVFLPQYLPGLNSKIFLKMDALQPSGSFKIRGIGYTIGKAHTRGCRQVISSSGGNAGYAAAWAGRQLKMAVTIVLPTTTPKFVVERLKGINATVVVHGGVWDEADKHARSLLQQFKETEAVYIHPFEGQDLVEGHATIVHEMAEQYKEIGEDKPDVIICVVGGGGLLCGIVEGCKDVGWSDVPIIATETEGANCLHAAMNAGKPIALENGITSIAKSLGAVTVSERAFNLTKQHPIKSCLVTDKQVVSAITKFADHHRLLVEPACAAGLAVVYEKHETLMALKPKSIAVIVCGGNIMTLDILQKLKESIGCSP